MRAGVLNQDRKYAPLIRTVDSVILKSRHFAGNVLKRIQIHAKLLKSYR